MVATITWVDRVENGGATSAGFTTAAVLNEIKAVVNANALTLDETSSLAAGAAKLGVMTLQTFAGPLRVGNVHIGAAPDGTPASTFVSALTAYALQLRGGIDTAGMILFKDASNTMVARIDPVGAATHAQTVITREKGDARYAQLGSSPIFTGSILEINAASPQLRFTENDQTAPAGRFRMWSFNNALFVDRSTSTPTDWTTAATIAQFDLEGTGASDPQTVMTREKGDARYLQLAGGSMSGPLVVDNISLLSNTLSNVVGSQVYNVPTSFYHLFRMNNVNAARVDPAGTTVSAAETVITREKGDARYMRGDVAADNSAGATLGTLRVGIDSSIQIRRNSQDMIFSVGSGQFYFRIGDVTAGPYVARIEAEGASAPQPYSIMTREKGDARYMNLTGGPSNALLGPLYTRPGGVSHWYLDNDGAASTVYDISPINPSDASSMSLRLGRSSPTGNISFMILNPGTTTPRVALRSNDTGSVEAGVGKFGNIYIGANPAGVANAVVVSSITGTAPVIRSGNTTGSMIVFHDANAALLATITVTGTSAPSTHTVITREKGDARYLLPNGSGAELTGIPIVGGTTGTLTVARGGTGATTASAALAALGGNNAANLTTGTLPNARLVGAYSFTDLTLSGTLTTDSILAQEYRSTSSGYYIGNGDNTTLAPYTGSAVDGIVRLRPNGSGSVTGELVVTNTAVTVQSGDIGAVSTLLRLRSGVQTNPIFEFRDSANTSIARVDTPDTIANVANTVITRTKGDARYTAASSLRFKTDPVPAQGLEDIFNRLVPKGFIWGGELPESDERIGTKGLGFIAEEVIEEIPEAGVYRMGSEVTEVDEDGEIRIIAPGEFKLHGLDPFAILAVYHAKIVALESRIAALEGN